MTNTRQIRFNAAARRRRNAIMRTVLAEDLLFGRVDIAQPDVHEAVGLEQRLDPVELGEVGPGQAEQERDGTSVYVSRVCRLGCVDVL